MLCLQCMGTQGTFDLKKSCCAFSAWGSKGLLISKTLAVPPVLGDLRDLWSQKVLLCLKSVWTQGTFDLKPPVLGDLRDLWSQKVLLCLKCVWTQGTFDLKNSCYASSAWGPKGPLISKSIALPQVRMDLRDLWFQKVLLCLKCMWTQGTFDLKKSCFASSECGPKGPLISKSLALPPESVDPSSDFIAVLRYNLYH